MTHYLLTFLIIIILGATIGCREQVSNALPPPAPTSPTIRSTMIPTATPTIPPAPIPTFTPPRVPPTPSADSTPTPTPTFLPTPLVVTSWSTFTYDINPPQISVDYPIGWDVKVTNIPDPDHLFWAQFHPPGDSSQQGVSVRVYRFDQIVDPRDGGWVEYLWTRPITTTGATGMMTLASAPSQMDLSSFYYSEKYNIQINIFFSPPIYVDPAILQSPSITDTITQQYGIYEHMVNSLRLTEPQ